MYDDEDLKLIISLISDLAVPGNTGYELAALVILVLFIIWRRKK